MDGTVWNIDEDAVQMDANGCASSATWSIHDAFCMADLAGSDMNSGMSQMDCLMLLFPPAAVCHIVTLTNVQLFTMQGQDDMDVGELWKFIGLLLIMTQSEFASCQDL